MPENWWVNIKKYNNKRSIGDSIILLNELMSLKNQQLSPSNRYVTSDPAF